MLNWLTMHRTAATPDTPSTVVITGHYTTTDDDGDSVGKEITFTAVEEVDAAALVLLDVAESALDLAREQKRADNAETLALLVKAEATVAAVRDKA